MRAHFSLPEGYDLSQFAHLILFIDQHWRIDPGFEVVCISHDWVNPVEVYYFTSGKGAIKAFQLISELTSDRAPAGCEAVEMKLIKSSVGMGFPPVKIGYATMSRMLIIQSVR